VQFETREVAVQGADAVIQVSAALKELDNDAEVDVIIITRGGGSFEDLLPFSDEGLVRLAANCKKPIVSAIGHEQDTPLLDLVADLRASTPTDAAKRVVPDIKEELEKIRQLRNRADQKINDRVILEMTKVVNLMQRSFAGINSRITRSSDELNHMLTQIRALSPQATLDRGYAVVQKSDGSIVRTPNKLTKGETLRLRLAEGVALATATGESELDRIRGE
jgi:exodeoxyribonuclease VII large subunit